MVFFCAIIDIFLFSLVLKQFLKLKEESLFGGTVINPNIGNQVKLDSNLTQFYVYRQKKLEILGLILSNLLIFKILYGFISF